MVRVLTIVLVGLVAAATVVMWRVEVWPVGGDAASMVLTVAGLLVLVGVVFLAAAVRSRPPRCPECRSGALVQRPMRDDDAVPRFECSECGAIVSADAEYMRPDAHARCRRCGTSLVPTGPNRAKCPSCDVDMEWHAEARSWWRVDDGPLMTCPSCGGRIILDEPGTTYTRIVPADGNTPATVEEVTASETQWRCVPLESHSDVAYYLAAGYPKGRLPNIDYRAACGWTGTESARKAGRWA